jgi:hypothetical protein
LENVSIPHVKSVNEVSKCGTFVELLEIKIAYFLKKTRARSNLNYNLSPLHIGPDFPKVE